MCQQSILARDPKVNVRSAGWKWWGCGAVGGGDSVCEGECGGRGRGGGREWG